MASELTGPPNVDVSDLTDSDLRVSANLHAQCASSLREIIRLRTSLLGANRELGELRQRLNDAERTSTEGQHKLNTCQERLHAVEDELQQTKCELGELKSGRADMELRLEDAETNLKAAERLLGEYVVKNDQLEASQKPIPGSLTRIDASVATSSIRKRARSPSLEIIESSNLSPVRAKGVSAKKSLESTPCMASLHSKCNTTLPSRRSESQASCLPTPPPSSNMEECSVSSAKRRKVGIDGEVMDFKIDSGSDLKSNQPSNTVPRVNDTENVSTNVSPRIPPVTSLSSDSDRTEAPSHHKGTETTDSMDVEPSPSPTTNVSLQLPTGPPAPLSNELMPPTSIETSTNPSQLTTTTANTLPSSTPSAPTASVSCSVLPQSSPAQTTAVNPPPSPTTTGAAPITPRNVSTHAPLGKVAPPPTSLSNAIRDIIIGMKDLEGPLPPTLTAAGARRSDQPPACSASVTPIVCQNAASQIQPSHDQGKQTENSSLTTPASTQTQQVSLQTARPGNQASARHATATGSVLQPSAVLDNPPSKAGPVAGPSRPSLRAHDKSLPNALHPVQCQTDESHYLDTSYMLPALASMVQKYLPSTNAKILPIFPSPLKTEVPRAFLISAYGGAARQWLQIFRKDKHPKGAIERRVVFPQFGLNPAMPIAPGHPGLMFASRHEILENPPWTVFRKGSTASGKAVWLYLGDYECELVGMMTGKEFSDLAISVKSEWAKALLVVKQFDIYVSMRARIALRKHGCIPLKDKNKEDALISKEMDAIKAKNGRSVDPGDIISALERGDERIDIIRMICIKYDHAFAKDMKRKFIEGSKASFASASVTSEPSSSHNKSTGSSTPASAASNAPVLLENKPVPRNRNPFAEESEEDENEDDSEFELDASLPKVPSDRKLRPRASRVIAIED